MEKTVDRRVRKTKNQLRQGLARLMLEKSLKEITVKELTDLVDMNRGTFYLHYRDIYDLYAQIEAELPAAPFFPHLRISGGKRGSMRGVSGRKWRYHLPGAAQRPGS